MYDKLVTIIVPMYNIEQYITKCIESFKQVDKKYYADFEVIVVNDGSTDNSLQVVEDLIINSCLNIRVVNKENGGHGSTINVGKREKRANILEAQAKRESAILVAEGEKQAAILRAEAKKEQAIKEAEGEAEAILSIQKAKAEALRLLNEAKPTPEVLSLKGMEAFEKAADGNATKIIVPANFQNLASTITAFAELNEKTEN